MLTLEAALDQQHAYRAKQAERDKLRDTDLVTFVGGVAVGKNYLMQKSGLYVCGTETSRAPRADDDATKYTYASNEEMLAGIEAGELIQYGVHLPDTIYGSRIRDYRLGEPNAADIWFDAVSALGNKGFRTVKAVSIFTPATQWYQQLQERFEDRPPAFIIDRLNETRHSIRWSVAQHLSRAAHHLLIINDSAHTSESIDRIQAFAANETVAPLDDLVVSQAQDEMNKMIERYLGELQ